MMNCQNAEQLIPLFVEADLDAAEMQQVTEHLATCDACGEIVAEFEASQSFLRATALPEFDEAGLRAMRTAVQDEIARPTIADWIALFWHWKFAATSIVCLLLGAFMLYQQVAPNPERKQIVVQADRQSLIALPTSSDERATRSGTVPRVVASRRPTRKPSQNPSARATARRSVPLIAEPVTIQPSTALALTASPEIAIPAAEPEMLRMEIHTADPNIKIIWLTPKEPTRAIPAPLIEATK